LNAHVVGISADKPESQLKFIDKYTLTYPMVPDPDKDIIRAFGVPIALGLAAQRTTFLVDPEGLVARVWPKVNVKGHADDVVNAIRQMRAA
jgi:peroxiredoxin Q/BCP